MGACHSNGSATGGKGSYPEQISSTVKGYNIEGNVVTTRSGQKVTVKKYEEIKDKGLMAKAKNAGLEDPVQTGRALIEREAANRAIEQEKKERENYQKNMEKNVKGYNELSGEINKASNERELSIKSIEKGEVLKSPAQTKVAELKKRYPRAAAYIQAENYAYSSNYDKSSAGKKAMETIRKGGNYKKAIKEMEERWKKSSTRGLYR